MSLSGEVAMFGRDMKRSESRGSVDSVTSSPRIQTEKLTSDRLGLSAFVLFQSTAYEDFCIREMDDFLSCINRCSCFLLFSTAERSTCLHLMELTLDKEVISQITKTAYWITVERLEKVLYVSFLSLLYHYLMLIMMMLMKVMLIMTIVKNKFSRIVSWNLNKHHPYHYYIDYNQYYYKYR